MPKTDVGDMLRFLCCKHLAAAALDRTDRELLKHFAATRKDGPFTVLFERHRGMVMGVCKRILGDLHLAEDSFQATFHVLARQAGSIHLRGTLGPWLYRVAQRTALRARTEVLRRRVQEKRYADMPHSHVLDDGSSAGDQQGTRRSAGCIAGKILRSARPLLLRKQRPRHGRPRTWLGGRNRSTPA